MLTAGVLLGFTVVLIALGVAETLRHRRNLAAVPIRVHVNGTRGKSSVTRLIAAGLRAGGVATCAKTTGTLPRLILPSGRELPIFRTSRSNVIEQVGVVSTAASLGARALVVECMALQPFLQWLSEWKLVQATHAVITNARADHLLVMGPTEEDVALALAGTVPRGGELYTAERRHLAVLEGAACDRDSVLHAVGDEDVAAVTPDEMAGFAYVEHPENVALALRVCLGLGVDRPTALRGMHAALPDPGAMTEHELDFFGRRIIFANGFAANDPESTERIWNIALDHYPELRHRIAVFNCRADRPDRSLQLGEAYMRWRPADHVVLIGSGTYLFARAASKAGLDPSRIIFAEDRQPDEIFETIIDLAGPSALVMGMGNIGGPGLDLVRYFRNRSILKDPA